MNHPERTRPAFWLPGMTACTVAPAVDRTPRPLTRCRGRYDGRLGRGRVRQCGRVDGRTRGRSGRARQYFGELCATFTRTRSRAVRTARAIRRPGRADVSGSDSFGGDGSRRSSERHRVPSPPTARHDLLRHDNGRGSTAGARADGAQTGWVQRRVARRWRTSPPDGDPRRRGHSDAGGTRSAIRIERASACSTRQSRQARTCSSDRESSRLLSAKWRAGHDGTRSDRRTPRHCRDGLCHTAVQTARGTFPDVQHVRARDRAHHRWSSGEIGLSDVMVWNTARPYHYARWTSDHRLLMGGADRPCAPANDDSAIRPCDA